MRILFLLKENTFLWGTWGTGEQHYKNGVIMRYFLFPKCSPSVPQVFPKRSPSVPQVFPKRSPSVPQTFPKCSPNVPQNRLAGNKSYTLVPYPVTPNARHLSYPLFYARTRLLAPLFNCVSRNEKADSN